MLHHPTLSVVMANYNHARFLPESLRAILDQSYRPAEIIIIDDASKDNSVEVIKEFAGKEPIIRILHNERNMGALHTINRLFELSTGEYVCSLAADDKVLPGFFEKSMTLLARYPQAGLCSTLGLYIDETGKDMGLVGNPIISETECFITPAEALHTLRRVGPWVMGSSVIFRRQALIDAGGFIPELHSFCDWFIHQVIALRYGACFIPEPLACWRSMASGWHAATTVNIRGNLEIMQHAAMLMRSTYSDLFPKDYVGERLYKAGQEAWRTTVLLQEELLQSPYWLLPQRNWVNKVFLAGLRLSVQVQDLAVRLYLFLRFRNARRWLARKRAKSLPR
ncbi:glycosyltransferase family 2 protein [bacterium]|nr:glycosyltransferase family 2 protein [bacterium]